MAKKIENRLFSGKNIYDYFSKSWNSKRGTHLRDRLSSILKRHKYLIALLLIVLLLFIMSWLIDENQIELRAYLKIGFIFFVLILFNYSIGYYNQKKTMEYWKNNKILQKYREKKEINHFSFYSRESSAENLEIRLLTYIIVPLLITKIIMYFINDLNFSLANDLSTFYNYFLLVFDKWSDSLFFSIIRFALLLVSFISCISLPFVLEYNDIQADSRFYSRKKIRNKLFPILLKVFLLVSFVFVLFISIVAVVMVFSKLGDHNGSILKAIYYASIIGLQKMVRGWIEKIFHDKKEQKIAIVSIFVMIIVFSPLSFEQLSNVADSGVYYEFKQDKFHNILLNRNPSFAISKNDKNDWIIYDLLSTSNESTTRYELVNQDFEDVVKNWKLRIMVPVPQRPNDLRFFIKSGTMDYVYLLDKAERVDNVNKVKIEKIKIINETY